jgi:DNA polymerase-3 subunit beta
MNVTCKTENLSDAFQLVASVVETKATKRILQDVKAETVGDKVLQLSATDLEIGVKCVVEAVEVKAKGAIVVPAASVSAILRESSDEAIELSLEGDNCQIKGRDSVFKLPTQDPDEFPVIPDFPDQKTIEIGKDDLRMMIRRTSFCAAVEQTRYALNGVLFVSGNGELTMVATDGRRLARITRKAKGGSSDVKQAIVPTKAVVLLDRMLVEEGENIELSFHENKLWARTGNAVLCTSLVEGQFPDYEGVIPAECEAKISVQVAAMTTAYFCYFVFFNCDRACRLNNFSIIPFVVDFYFSYLF